MFKRFWWMFFVMVPLGSIAGLLAAAVITYMMPKKYESETIIQIMPRSQAAGMEGFASQAVPQPAAEAQILKSRKALDQVAANLDLPNRWNVDKETAIRILKAIVGRRPLDAQDYVDAKREYDTEHELLQQMKLKLMGEKHLPQDGLRQRPDPRRARDRPSSPSARTSRSTCCSVRDSAFCFPR